LSNKKNSIKYWSEQDRPREKLNSQGARALSNAELLAILIGSGTPNESAVELCRKITQTVNNNLNQLAKLTVADLTKFKGIGPAKAINIIAAMELGRRRKEEEPQVKVKIATSKNAFEAIAPYLLDLKHEEFWILLLDRSNKVIETVFISKGGVTATVVDVKIILQKAIEKLASGIILCHNHPSENRLASTEDLKITTKIKEAAKLIDINVLDHIIVCGNSYISLADENKI
jgi:DNA repair protein RadC